MKDYTNWAAWIKAADSNIKLFIHIKCDEKELDAIFFGLRPSDIKNAGVNDGKAHVIDFRANTAVYRTGDEIYCIPAKTKPFPMGIIDNNDGSKPIVVLTLDFPFEMKREDLVEY